MPREPENKAERKMRKILSLTQDEAKAAMAATFELWCWRVFSPNADQPGKYSTHVAFNPEGLIETIHELAEEALAIGQEAGHWPIHALLIWRDHDFCIPGPWDGDEGIHYPDLITGLANQWHLDLAGTDGNILVEDFAVLHEIDVTDEVIDQADEIIARVKAVSFADDVIETVLSGPNIRDIPPANEQPA